MLLLTNELENVCQLIYVFYRLHAILTNIYLTVTCYLTVT